MTDPSNLDDKGRAELLCYLVVGQLVARARTGGWLQTDQRVELLNIWFNGHQLEVDWPEGVYLCALSETIALDFVEVPSFTDSAWLAKLFGDGPQIEYRSPYVWNIHAACANQLKTG
jgi:hypothetical protein